MLTEWETTSLTHYNLQKAPTFAFLCDHRFCNSWVFRGHKINVSAQNQQNLDYMCKTYKNKPGPGSHHINTCTVCVLNKLNIV